MLTDRQIQAALKTVQTEVTLNDGSGGRGTGSLHLVVRRTQSVVSAVWFGSWKRDGKRQKKSIGRYPDLGLRDARDRFADTVRAVLQTGQNPKTKADKHDRPTVASLFTAYIDHLKAENKPSVYNIERMLLTGKYAAADHLGRERLAGDITPDDVSAHLYAYFKRGSRRQADISRTCMAAAFNFGIKSAHTYTTAARHNWGIKINPAAMVAKDTEASRPRDRNLSAEELAAVWHGLDAGFYPDTADAIRLLITCGQRVRETLRAEGSDFDLQAGVWHMPAHKTKGGKPHSLPLPEQAITVVQNLIARHGDGHLFPARTGSSAALLADTSIARGLRRWSRDNGIDDFQPKDFRRTWKSRAGEIGIDRFTRDLIQQHAMSDTGSRHYDRSDYFPQMREAMAKWSNWLNSVIKSDAWQTKSTLQTITHNSCSIRK